MFTITWVGDILDDVVDVVWLLGTDSNLILFFLAVIYAFYQT